MRARAAVAAALLALAVLAGTAGAAAAHAGLVGSDPSDGEVLATAPRAVRLTFSGPVVPVGPGVRVLDARARRVDAGPLEGLGAAVVGVRLPTALPPGVYVTTYRVASEDGHTMRGAVTFTVASAGATDPSGSAGAATAAVTERVLAIVDARRGEAVVATVGSLLRTGTYLTALLAVGAVLFATLVARRDAHREIAWRPVRPAALATVAMTLVALPVQLVALVGLDRQPVARALAELAAVPSSRAVLLRLVAAGLLVLVGRRWVLALPAAFLVLASFVIEGHQFDVEPNEVLRLADTVHLVTGALWVGGVVVLAMVFAARARDPAAMSTRQTGDLVARYSGFAVVSVGATLFSGTVMTGILVGDPREVLTTTYGRVLVAKLAFVGLVLALAAYNRLRLVPLLRSEGGPDDDASWARLVTTARGEAVLLLGVLAVVGLLVVQRPPVAPSAVGTVASAPLVDAAVAVTVDVVVDPAVAGRNVLDVYALERSGRPAGAVRDARVEATARGAGAAPVVPVPLSPAGPGHWSATTDALGSAGAWRLTVVLTLVDGREASATVDLEVDAP